MAFGFGIKKVYSVVWRKASRRKRKEKAFIVSSVATWHAS